MSPDREPFEPVEPVEPGPAGDAEQAASELFVDGLLRWHHLDRDAAQERRVDAALRAIDGRPQHRLRPLRVAVAAAALLIVAIAVAAWSAGGDRAPGKAEHEDRRYRVAAWLAGEPEPVLEGELDVRDRDHHVLLATLHGYRVRTGADGGAPWLGGDDQVLAHLHARTRDLRATLLADGLAVLDNAAALLPELRRTHALEAPTAATLPGRPGVTFEHHLARAAAPSSAPHEVEVWIDPRSGRVERMELRWDPRTTADLMTPSAMVVEHVTEPVLPDGWFRAATHDR